MKCKEIRGLLPELAGGEIGPRERALCEAHLQSCAACAGEYEELARAVDLLRRAGQQAEDEGVPPGFSQRLRLRLAQEPAPRRPLWGGAWQRVGEALRGAGGPAALAVCGAAAVVLLVLRPGPAVTPAPGPGPVVASAPEVAPFRVPQRRVAVVNVDFVTDEVIDDVDFEVTLPAGLAFISDGKPIADRMLRWHGSLAPGSNPVPLSVSGNQPGRYKITARAHAPGADGIEVVHDVLLEVVSS